MQSLESIFEERKTWHILQFFIWTFFWRPHTQAGHRLLMRSIWREAQEQTSMKQSWLSWNQQDTTRSSSSTRFLVSFCRAAQRMLVGPYIFLNARHAGDTTLLFCRFGRAQTLVAVFQVSRRRREENRTLVDSVPICESSRSSCTE
jgi:hypothetical protein